MFKNEQEFSEYCNNLCISDRAKTFIRNAILKRSREPRATPLNKLYSFASQKMGVVIVCEGEWEYQTALTLEYGNATGYLEQPPTEYVKSPNKSGKAFGRKTTTDFIAFFDDRVEIYEVKPLKTLEKMHKDNPLHITKDNHGNYDNPAARKHFKERFDFDFKIVTELDFDLIVNGNYNFLQNYYHSPQLVPEDELNALQKAIRQDSGSTIEELFRDSGIPLETIYRAIAKKQIFAPFGYRPISEHHLFRVFTSEYALKRFRLGYENIPNDIRAELELSPGVHFWFEASDQDKAEASFRARTVLYHRAHTKWPEWLPEIKHKSAYRWKLNYEKSEAVLGAGILGIIPNRKNRGPRGFQGSEAVYQAMKETKELNWDNSTKKPFSAVYADLSNRCDELGEITPGEDTFRKFLKNNQTEKSQSKRDGGKVAHTHSPTLSGELYKGMTKGQFLLDQTAMDHTQCNVFVRLNYMSSEIKLRPWLTLLTDSLSRKVLGFYISLLSPSKINIFMVMRRFLLDYGVVMRHLGVDGGAEFDSKQFNSWLPMLQAHKITRRSSRARGGTKVERPNKTITDGLFHYLKGNSQQTEFVRAMDPKLDPRKNTIWTLATLYKIVEFYFREKYHKGDIGKVGPSPNAIWEREYYKLSNGILTPAPSKPEILLETRIPVKKGGAILDRNGLSAQYLEYSNAALKESKNLRKKIPIQWDPDDAGIASAYIDGEWQTATSDFKGEFMHLDPLEILSRSQEIRYCARNTADKKKFKLDLNKKLVNEIAMHEAKLERDPSMIGRKDDKPNVRPIIAKGGLAKNLGFDCYDAGELEFEDD